MKATQAFVFAAVIGASACVLDFERFEGTASGGGAPTGPGGGGDATTTTTGGGATTVGGGGGVPASCDNGVVDGDESDVDCGGESCPPCDLGAICSGAGDCASGACVDGVCCDDACDGLCLACDTPRTGKALGICAPILPGIDPDDECAAQVCDGSGACADPCGLAPTPPGDVCPAACSSCSGGACIIQCTNQDSCAGETVSCPQGWNCQVACSGNNTCSGATIECPEGYACDVSCTANSACANVQVDCASGACSLACGSNVGACTSALLACGPNTCTATCAGATKPTVACGSSCDCTDCP